MKPQVLKVNQLILFRTDTVNAIMCSLFLQIRHTIGILVF